MASRADKQFIVLRWYRALRRFIKDAMHELREVVWPSGQEIRHYTVLVFTVLIGVAIWIGTFELVFTWLTGLLDLYGTRGAAL